MRRLAPLALPAVLVACGGVPEPRNMSRDEIAGALEQIEIAPGLWEVTSAITDVSGPNLPYDLRRRMIGPRATVRHCITPAQARRPSAGFLAGRDDDRCRYRGFSMAGGRLRGTMICVADRGGGPVETAMVGRYGPAGYVLRMEMRNPMPDGTVMRVTIANRGRRIGECAAREE